MNATDTSLERITSLYVDRGLYVLRYESSSDALGPPVATVRQAEGCESSIEIIGPPGTAPGELSVPGCCVVVLANAGGALHVSVRRKFVDGSLDASLRLEALAREGLSTRRSALQIGEASSDVDSDNARLAMIGHVSHRGDILVGQGEWVAGPDSPSPIEGIEIRNKPTPALSVQIQVLSSDRGATWSKWVESGSFAGSRGRRLPLVGVKLRLQGTEAELYELACDALFLGSPITSKRGREVELISGSATDPLVGLRLELRRAEAARRRPTASRNEQLREPRVQVFRATGMRSVS